MKREIVQTYGYRYLFTLDHLSKLGTFDLSLMIQNVEFDSAAIGMLKVQTRSNNFTRLRSDLNLIVENISEADPTDIAYVYSGYAPLRSISLESFSVSLVSFPF